MEPFFVLGLYATLGVLLQLGVAMGLASLFLARRPGEAGDGGAGMWGLAWLVQAVAVGTLALRFILLPNLDLSRLQEGSADVRALYTVYGVAKVAFFALVAAGAVRVRHPVGERRMLGILWAAAALQACVAVTAAGDLTRTVQWTAPFAAVCLIVAAAMVWRGRKGHDRVGCAVTLAGLTLMACVSILDVEVYRVVPPVDLAPLATLRRHLHFDFLVRANSYVDTTLHVLFGIGSLRLTRRLRSPRQARGAPDGRPLPA